MYRYSLNFLQQVYIGIVLPIFLESIVKNPDHKPTFIHHLIAANVSISRLDVSGTEEVTRQRGLINHTKQKTEEAENLST